MTPSDKQKSRDQRYIERRHANGYINLRVWVKKEDVGIIKSFIEDIESTKKFEASRKTEQEFKDYINERKKRNKLTDYEIKVNESARNKNHD